MDGLARSALNYIVNTTEFSIPLSWSTWEDEISPGAVSRFQDFYEFSISPSASFGGMQYFEAWDCNSINYEQTYEEQVNIPSSLAIDLQFEQNRTDTFTLTAEVEVADNLTTTNNKIFFVITNWVEYSLDNPWYFLVVAKSDEEDFNLTTTGEIGIFTTELTADMQEDWFLGDLRAVTVVQNWDSKEILQAAQKQFEVSGSANHALNPDFSLRNFPNPFNPVTTIQYSLTERSDVKMEVFNQKGQKIITLVNSIQETGNHQVVWNGTDGSGKPVASGIYLYKIYTESSEGGRYTSIKKMILLK